MRRKLVRIVSILLVLEFGAGPGRCEDTVTDKKASKDAATSEIAEDVSLTEFRMLLCDAAVDDQSPIHGEAVRIVSIRKFTDSRFDEYVRRSFGAESPAISFNTAMELMSVSSLSKGEKVNLLLNYLVTLNEEFESEAGTNFGEWSQKNLNVARVNQALATMKRELASELKVRLAVEHPPTILVASAELTREESSPLIPLLLAVAKKGDPKGKLVAVRVLDRSLSLLEQSARDAKTKQTRREAIDADGLDERTVLYASKIIARFDKNDDQTISPEEWKDMLIDPTPADTDQNGRVTIKEYASWMQRRSSR